MLQNLVHKIQQYKSCTALLNPQEQRKHRTRTPFNMKLQQVKYALALLIAASASSRAPATLASSELDDAMKRCFAEKDRLVFLDINVDQNEHVYPMQIKFGSMKDMRLSKSTTTLEGDE